MNRARLIAFGLGAAVLWAGAAQSADVVVLSSYPEEMTNRYERAFEQAHPDMRVRLMWQQGREAMATLRKPDQGGVDVYWTPSLINFPVLAAEGAFQPIHVDRKKLPGRIGAQELSDPNGRFEAFEIAGYGVAVNPAVLKQRHIATPSSWDDLLKPAFAGSVTLPVPRIGFAPQLYDIILQSKGWADGWTFLSELAAHGQLAKGGGEFVNGVADGTVLAALTIDFVVRNAAANGRPLALTYVARTAFLPAHVAIAAKAPHPDTAQVFADFLLSEAGQKLLFTPEASRYPVRPDAYAAAPKDIIDPFKLPKSMTFDYDAVVGPQQGPLINAVFEAAITARIDTVRDLWKSIHAAEAAAKSAQDRAKIAEARKLVGWVPVTTAEASDPKFLASFQDGNGKSVQSPDQAADWARQLADKETQARAILKSVEHTASR